MFPGAEPVTAVSWVPEMGVAGDEVMSCMQLGRIGRPLHLVERPRPQPSASDLLIKVVLAASAGPTFTSSTANQVARFRSFQGMRSSAA